ncbi:hypothetical protein FA95DRAFT_1613099 [Auriscalpium vulgare]|uniref:Uncharacterized protein n=1 Tax=Auriscalpium vulgare TaxID=40419 RepID=A0ACB8R3W0_9AGAM|nr:hypothetical protein FA95DRAFT_1613099 [Auriscalpium vulgare]
MLRLAKNPHDALAPDYTDEELATIFPGTHNLDVSAARARLEAAWTSSNTRAILAWDAQVAADEAAADPEAALSRQLFTACAMQKLRAFQYCPLDFFTEVGLQRFHASSRAARADSDGTRIYRYTPRPDRDLPWDEFCRAVPALLRAMAAAGWTAPHIPALRTFFDTVQAHSLRRTDPVHGEKILLRFAGLHHHQWTSSLGLPDSYNIALWNEEVLHKFADRYYDEVRSDMLFELEQRMAELEQERAHALEHVDFRACEVNTALIETHMSSPNRSLYHDPTSLDRSVRRDPAADSDDLPVYSDAYPTKPTFVVDPYRSLTSSTKTI